MSSIRKIMHGLWVGLLKIQVVVMVASFIICMLCMLVEVTFRYILQMPVFGFEEVASAVCIWLYFIGSSYGTYQKAHLNSDILPLIIKRERGRVIAAAVVSVVSLCLAGYFLKWSYDYFMFNISTPRLVLIGGVIGQFPMIYSQAGIFVGIILMVFYLIIESIKNVSLYLKNQSAV